ncbi:Wadjet anti-phage system protein JetD domain-containing protein [Pseudomonas putida]|uniref:Wadjet anti-phage system protein JetD domain-containing protein n=1 Tax=Pseudomonas putida TaxID=303 RepID=UPI001E4F828B|nr:Wadjet anti-phage system protein JetD domain-containing protein [Pseudomonas putida]
MATSECWKGSVGTCELQGWISACFHFHALLVAHRSLWMTKPCEEVITTARLAMQLSPGCANGRPLRLVADYGVDTKFFERNLTLLTRLLQWLGSVHLAEKQIAYWGDMDSWGMLMLARARCHHPGIKALLMQRLFFEQHCASNAVIEPTRAQNATPLALSDVEGDFYQYLLLQARGRLEQEYLPRTQVELAIREWAM